MHDSDVWNLPPFYMTQPGHDQIFGEVRVGIFVDSGVFHDMCPRGIVFLIRALARRPSSLHSKVWASHLCVILIASYWRHTSHPVVHGRCNLGLKDRVSMIRLADICPHNLPSSVSIEVLIVAIHV